MPLLVGNQMRPSAVLQAAGRNIPAMASLGLAVGQAGDGRGLAIRAVVERLFGNANVLPCHRMQRTNENDIQRAMKKFPPRILL